MICGRGGGDGAGGRCDGVGVLLWCCAIHTGASCETSNRPVLLTLLHTASTSHGRMLWRSISSQLMPSSSAAMSQAFCNTCTCEPQPTTVISVPSCTMSALPSGMVKSPVGTSSTAARYSAFGSKKMHGLSSRMQDSSRPFAAVGERGIAIFKPGVWAKYASGLWLW